MSNNQITFERIGNSWHAEGKRAEDHRLHFPKGSGHHDIRFAIDAPDGRYRFNTEDPIWVHDGNGCPPPGSGHAHIEITNCDARHLSVHNSNREAVQLHYQLNVIDSRDGSPCPIDPIIDNGGHG